MIETGLHANFNVTLYCEYNLLLQNKINTSYEIMTENKNGKCE